MVVKKLLPKAYNQYATNQMKNSSYRKLFAYQAQKEVRKLAIKSVRSSGDTANKSRRIAKEVKSTFNRLSLKDSRILAKSGQGRTRKQEEDRKRTIW